MKNKFMIKILTLALTVCLCVIGFTVAVSAEDTKSGTCGTEGSSVSWVLNTKTGVLQISGSGSIADYSATATNGTTAAPWRSYASSVKSIIVKEGIVRIGKNAFSGLTGAKTLTLPEGLVSMGENAFLHCLSLTTLEIPSSVTEIGENAFANCGSIESISVADGNTVYRAEANCLIQINNETVIRGSRNVDLPENVKYIGEYAFSGCDIKSVTLPDSVIHIGYGAFAECEGIEEITVPFVGDCRLDKDGNPTYKLSDADETRGKYLNTLWYLFGDKGTPDTLKKVTLTDCIYIGKEAFLGASGLTTVNLPDTVKVIGEAAFSGCSSLEFIELPEGLENIKESAFKECGALVIVKIPDSVTSVEGSAFDGCVKLEKVIIGKGTSKIGEGSFYRCPKLSELVVTQGNTVYYSESGCIIESATMKLVLGCKNSVIPKNVKIIGIGAFKNCISLVKITLPDGLTAIEKSAFESCTGLTEITVPENVKTIGDSAFSGCVNLSLAKISQSTKVGESAFKNCTSLDSNSLYIYSGSWGVTQNVNNAWLWWLVAGVGVAAVAVVAFSLVTVKKRK